MPRIILTTAVAIALASVVDAKTRVVRTIQEARSLTHENFLSPIDFELRGQLINISPKYNDHDSSRSIVIKQDGGRLRLNTSKEQPPRISAKPGDTVVLRGQTEVHNKIYDRFRVDSVELLARGEEPAPEKATLAEILEGRHDLKVVTVRGNVSAIIKDDIDDKYHHCVLHDGKRNIHLSIKDESGNAAWINDLAGATIEATGLCSSFFGLRRFSSPGVHIRRRCEIRVLRAAPDPFNAPELENMQSMLLGDVLKMGRRKVHGRVLATWDSNRLLLKTRDGRVVRIDLAPGTGLPHPGEAVCAAGTVATDFFRMNLVDAVLQKLHGEPPPADKEEPIDGSVFARDMQNLRNKVIYFGKTVQIKGTVEYTMQTSESCVRVHLDAEGMRVIAVVDPDRIPTGEIVPGCKVEVTGIFATEGDNFQSDATLPRMREWFLVPRSADDLKILQYPPWWTAGRLGAVIAILFVALVASFAYIYALRLLANRRGRQLFREQIAHADAQLRIDERTRLAAELHDSLSQNLSGIACQISVARQTATDGETKSLLATAERMILSSRTELTRCIGDLRCNTLEEPNFCTAIKKNLDMLALPAKIVVRFAIPRAKVSDLTAHSMLCIIRELVTNAVRHGGASTVKVAGGMDGRGISFSVRDDGCGFDVNHRPGAQDGHFGLEGIKDRVRRLAGSFEIRSAPGKGTSARVFIPDSSHSKKDTSLA